MPKPSPTLTFLSLFTTVEKANEIEGDLIEQLPHHGKMWFRVHIVLTGLALFRQAILKNPVAVFLLSYATYELMTKALFLGIRPLQRYTLYELDLPGVPVMVLIYLLLFLGPFIVGGALMRFLPRLGIQVAIGAIALFVLRMVVLQEGYSLFQIALFVAAPVLSGSVYIHRKDLEQAIQLERAI